MAKSNQELVIQGVDWMKRIGELVDSAKAMGLRSNMIFNTSGGITAQDYSEKTLSHIDLYHDRVGIPNGYWIQSWYQLPGNWLPETEPYTMTNLTLKAIKKIWGEEPQKKLALLEPEAGKVYHGVQTMNFDGDRELSGYLGALNDSTLQPAVRGFFFTIPGSRGPAKALKGLADFYHTADSIGFIPELSLFLNDGIASTDSIIAVSDEYDWIIDSVIMLSKGYGKSMFLRIGGEFNGPWNGYHKHHYVTMFRKVVDRFEAAGFRDSIAVNWCYEPAGPNDFDSVDIQGNLWYPGDGYADWFGLDVFNPEDFDQSLPDYRRGIITPKGKSERFLAMAREKGKPVFLSETSAKGMNISNDYQDGINDWDNWFAKFWHFIEVHGEIKGFCYINTSWPDHAYPGWGDARIQNNTYVGEKYVEEMKKSRYIHLKTPSAPQQFPEKVVLISPENNDSVSGDEVTFLWHKSSPDIINYRLNIHIGRSVVFSDSTLTDTTCTYSGLDAEQEYLWRVQAKNSTAWGRWSNVWKFTAGTGAVADNLSLSGKVMIFPTPTNNFIIVKSEKLKDLDFEIISILGERVIAGVIKSKNERIDLSGLKPNIYFLRIGTQTHKILKTE
jgi:hypothetical protein